MKRIACPHCGPRDQNEFTWGGPAHLPRPPLGCSDEAWRDYVFVRANPRGASDERWCHTYGCGQWLRIERDTETHVIHRTGILDDAGAVLRSEAKDRDPGRRPE